MKTKTIRTEAEVAAAIAAPLTEGRRPLEVILKDGSITEVRLGLLHLSAAYGMTVVAEIEFEEAERYRVRVNHPAFPSLNRYFESDYEATKFRETYDAIDGATVDHRKVTVRLDDSGKVVAEVDGESVKPLVAQDNGDDIPF